MVELKDESTRTLLDVISGLFEDGGSLSQDLPLGVEKVEKITLDSIRINFSDEVDCELLTRIAEDEGYIVKSESVAPRVIDKGTIVARVGSRSDPGRRRDLFLYLIPSDEERMSMYRRVVAARKGVLDIETGRIDYERFYQYNLRIIRLMERYRKEKYQNIAERLNL
ncbi:MAG: hypothetical protein OEZ48_04400 [Candidatus Bathyarchaeota archaeon]|nr:hypothetical protein [Candidatus Bathyarchaeota archaeon]MDH5687084.1 hypothetical protein [Candidatus Bathyarchaeota archaeon]